VAVADGVFAWVQPDGSWWINNAGVIASDEGVVLVDTCATEQRTLRFLAAVERETGGAAVKLAVNTHLHGDHTHGNSLLPESTVLIAHERTRAGILADTIIDGCPPVWEPVPDWGKVARRAHDVTLTSELTIHHGDRRIELRHPGYSAHTPGDVVAWLPRERVLFAGDLLFNQVTPLVFMGSVDGALRSLDWLASFEPEVVVAGHGPIIQAAEFADVLATHQRYYRFVLDTAAAGRRAGLTPLEAAKSCDLGEFATLPDAERIVLNLHRAYADADGVELDVMVAMADAVAYNGGPLPCAV
jgi:cyclase